MTSSNGSSGRPLLVSGAENSAAPRSHRATTARPQPPRPDNVPGWGGVKPGISHGATDEYGYYSVENKVHFHDLHATMLHLLGLDHTRLTYRYSGRDFRLTDIHGEIVHDILA
ncbi:MAG: hypothetical protein Ct9H300mP1_35850 [Planctomycetaceae bacterium]|nr:MAG: hypothetical protein Ct9H300mP1_35850 [Planctomycetaceae bacterium]